MQIDEAARRVHLGRSVLFTGAGFSWGATSVAGQSLVGASGVAAEMAREIGEDESLPLDVVSDEYVSRKGGAADLINLLRRTFTVDHVEEYHTELIKLPWRRVYSTNYDNLLETCQRRHKVEPRFATLQDDPRSVLQPGLIVHLNGFVERLSSEYWDADTILTTSQYLSDKVRGSDWAEAMRSDFSLADSIFFMGYSLYDLDIARILFEIPDVIRKTFFIVGETPERASVLKAQRLGSVHQITVATASRLFPSAADADTVSPSPFLVSLTEVQTEPAAGAPSNDDVAKFLTKGDVDPRYVARSVIEGIGDYYVPRSEIGPLVDMIERGGSRVLLHANLGNGKTLALLELATILRIAGMTSYMFSGATEGLENDMAFLEAQGKEERARSTIFVEDGFVHASLVKDLSRNFPEINIVVTARSAAVETRLGSVETALGEPFRSVELNGLETAEVGDLDSILLNHGLWGEKQGWRELERQGFITNRCRGELSTTLLSVCKSTHIYRKMEELLEDVKKVGPQTLEGLVAVLCLSYAGYYLRVSQICEIIQEDLFKTSRVQGNEVMLEFMEFESNRVTVRSPVFAQAVLSGLISDHFIVEFLPRMVARLDQLSRTNSVYKVPGQRMMRFGFIEHIITGEQKPEKLIAYYENIRATGVGVENPQFWLQYAIARLSFRDYVGAEKNFAAAFGLAERMSFYNPFQIENHFARFLLESRTETRDWDDYFEAASRAHAVIRDQMRRYEEGNYPYKVALKYLDFIEARNSDLTKDQLQLVASWCDELLAIAAAAPPEVKRTGYWREFDRSMRVAKDVIREVS